ncbi:MAG: nitroreductase family protein [Gammaproteobacteria bacterium]
MTGWEIPVAIGLIGRLFYCTRHYRQLFREAGMIGQSLYLEAEATGISGTGIGYFFDDAIHETLGIGNDSLQCLYNFTVGAAMHDGRMVSLPPQSPRQECNDMSVSRLLPPSQGNPCRITYS